ncbi:MAG: hypothetical protein AAF823_02280 [Planctomycetota bacterium]
MSLALAAAVAHGQTNIRTETQTASPPLTQAQVQEIDTFIAHWLDALNAAQRRDDVGSARNRLISMAQLPGASGAFRDAYVRAMVAQASPMIEDADLKVRLNVMVTMARAKHVDSLDLARELLDDPVPAVRYWAAKTIDEVVLALPGGPDDLEAARREVLLTALRAAAADEDDESVLAQLLQAMASLGALDELIEVLDRRLTLHVADTELLYLPEREAMQRLYVRLVAEIAGGQQFAMEESILELTRVSSLYFKLATTQLAEAEAMQAELIDDKSQMITQSDVVLRWGANQLDQGMITPPPIATAVRAQEWEAIAAQLDFWRRELSQSPFLFDDEQLELPEPGDEDTP